jgi:hypothetical protein
MFANLRKMTDPNELGPFLDSNLIGSPETVCRRIEALIGLGFNYFMVSCAFRKAHRPRCGKRR